MKLVFWWCQINFTEAYILVHHKKAIAFLKNAIQLKVYIYTDQYRTQVFLPHFHLQKIGLTY